MDTIRIVVAALLTLVMATAIGFLSRGPGGRMSGERYWTIALFLVIAAMLAVVGIGHIVQTPALSP